MEISQDNVTLHDLRKHLTAKICGCVIQHEHIIPSTQTLAHTLAEEGAPEGYVVIAEGQSSGRGRSGNGWSSPVGSGIWMSLILRPSISIRNATYFTLLTAVAVQTATRALIDLPIQIKWPNDLLIHGKKVCGILTEVRSRHNKLMYMNIGIGLNVNTLQDDFPVEIQPLATSLLIQGGKKISRSLLISSILNHMEWYYLNYLEHGFKFIKEEWEAGSGILGKRIIASTPRGKVSGEALGLTDRGELLIQTKQGKFAINTPLIEVP